MKNLLDIKHWIFDLDNTLYANQTKVFSEVDKKMSAFISEKINVDLVKAKEIQKKYFYEYGTTLSGLMKLDGIDPHDFLEFVHDIDISWLPKDIKLKEELIKIKEKKYIFTNGSHAHVKNITKQLGIDGLFDGAFDIVDANFVPKPHIDPYKKIIEKFNIDPTKSILIEDIAHNLEQAKNLGMKTCWLENDESFAKKDANKPYIDYKIKSLPSFLQEINILKAA
jgi:putative hydrolase of the HAD superfamily